MIAVAESATPARKPRRVVARSSRQPAERPIKTAVCLSPEAMRRLAVFCAVENRTQSSVVEELIGSSPMMKRYVVQDRSRDRAASGNPDDQVTGVVSAS